jgi:hypothetical protein
MSGRERFWAIGIRVRVDGGTVCTIDRVAVPRSGWWQVTYSGRRYQLFGGDRCDYFINLHRPCKRREKTF